MAVTPTAINPAHKREDHKGFEFEVDFLTEYGRVQELTASGAVNAKTKVLELNHASVVIAATYTVVPNTIFIVKDTSATGTAAHTLTLTGGTFNGTNTVATLNARDEFLIVHFDSAGRGQVIANVGSVALS